MAHRVGSGARNRLVYAFERRTLLSISRLNARGRMDGELENQPADSGDRADCGSAGPDGNGEALRRSCAALPEYSGASSVRELRAARGQRVQLFYSKADASLTALFDPEVRIPKGQVTVRQIAALYPYDNELLVIEGTGKMVKVALENAARFFSESGMPGFNYDMAKVWSMKSTAHSTKATAHATCVGTASRSRRSKSCASRCSQKCRRSDPARQAGRAFRWSLR